MKIRILNDWVRPQCEKVIFFLDPDFAKEKVPQFIQAKRQMRAGLKGHTYSSLINSVNLIQYKNLFN